MLSDLAGWRVVLLGCVLLIKIDPLTRVPFPASGAPFPRTRAQRLFFMARMTAAHGKGSTSRKSEAHFGGLLSRFATQGHTPAPLDRNEGLRAGLKQLGGYSGCGLKAMKTPPPDRSGEMYNRPLTASRCISSRMSTLH